MKLKQTTHSYYCEDTQYSYEFESFEHFKECWCTSEGLIDDCDYNFLVRYDIQKKSAKKYTLRLVFIHQRKGHLVPITIKEICQEDMAEIETMLKDAWEYMKELWVEVSKEEKNHECKY